MAPAAAVPAIESAVNSAAELASAVETPAKKFSFDWKQVEAGIPLAVLEEFAAYSGFGMKALLEVVIPLRTLKHRRERKEPLNVDESDRLARVARLYELAVQVFANEDKARRWLTKPKVRFDGKTPLSLARTNLGGNEVEEMLVQLEEGMFA